MVFFNISFFFNSVLFCASELMWRSVSMSLILYIYLSIYGMYLSWGSEINTTSVQADNQRHEIFQVSISVFVRPVAALVPQPDSSMAGFALTTGPSVVCERTVAGWGSSTDWKVLEVEWNVRLFREPGQPTAAWLRGRLRLIPASGHTPAPRRIVATSGLY